MPSYKTSGSSLLCPIMTPWAAALREGKQADVTGAGTARRPCLASSGCWKGGTRRREGHAPVLPWTSLWAWAGRAEDAYSSLRLTLKYENKHTETLESVRLNHSAGRVLCKEKTQNTRGRQHTAGDGGSCLYFTKAEADAGRVTSEVSLGYTAQFLDYSTQSQ